MKLLNEIQKTLKAPKDQFNSFGNYKYRSCSDIVEAVKPLMGNASLTMSDEIVLIGDRYYVRATVTFSHEGESVSVTAYAREALARKGMNEDQLTGATSSYARKYALNGLFAIDDARDSDDTNQHGKGDGEGEDQNGKAPANSNGANGKKPEPRPQPKPEDDMTKLFEQAFFDFNTEHADEIAKGFACDAGKFKEALRKQFKSLPAAKKKDYKWTAESIKELAAKVKSADVLVEVK